MAMASEKEKQWESVQVKGFTAWINSYLEPKGLKVSNLDSDLSNGVRLCTFLETAKDRNEDWKKKKLPKWEKNPTIRFQFIENVNSSLKFVQQEMKIKLVAIGAEDIVDNNIKYILGLLWSIFRKLRDVQLGVSEESGASDEQQALLQWVRKMTEGYEGVEIKGFKDSWSDGLALCALCHRFDSNLIDYDSLKKENKEHNVKLAFEQAEKHIGIPSLLDVDEVVKGTPDERSAVFYISLFFHAFVANEEKLKILETQKKAVSSISELRSQLEIEQSANKELKSKFHLLEEESSKEKELRHKLEAQLSEEQKN